MRQGTRMTFVESRLAILQRKRKKLIELFDKTKEDVDGQMSGKTGLSKAGANLEGCQTGGCETHLVHVTIGIYF